MRIVPTTNLNCDQDDEEQNYGFISDRQHRYCPTSQSELTSHRLQKALCIGIDRPYDLQWLIPLTCHYYGAQIKSNRLMAPKWSGPIHIHTILALVFEANFYNFEFTTLHWVCNDSNKLYSTILHYIILYQQQQQSLALSLFTWIPFAPNYSAAIDLISLWLL